MTGIFITFEGIEGSGKSTQIELFADYLKKKGKEVFLTREPGGTDIGDQIRKTLLNPKNTEMSGMTELLLYAAARSQHVNEKIRPALKANKIVLSDRYADATTAYQGQARNISFETLKKVHKIATDSLYPDITFLFDLPPQIGLKRAIDRNQINSYEDRFENEKIEFHKKVRAGYLKIANKEPERFVIIDAIKPVEETQRIIIEEYKKRSQKLCGKR